MISICISSAQVVSNGFVLLDKAGGGLKGSSVGLTVAAGGIHVDAGKIDLPATNALISGSLLITSPSSLAAGLDVLGSVSTQTDTLRVTAVTGTSAGNIITLLEGNNVLFHVSYTAALFVLR